MMKLLPNEETILTSDNNIILSSYRINKSSKMLGKSYSTTIFLEDISSIETNYTSNIVLLIIGIVVSISVFYISGQFTIGIVALILTIILFLLSRKHTITISSDGGSSMKILVSGMSDEKVESFCHSIYDAKLNRMKDLNHSKIN